MKKKRRVLLVLLVSATLVGSQTGCNRNSNKIETVVNKAERKYHLKGVYGHRPWKGGTGRKAMMMALAMKGIPMAQYHFSASTDGKSYGGVLVGGSPFDRPLKATTISAIVVPVKVSIGSATFDPTAPDCRDPSVTALSRFRESPLANDVPNLTLNGVNVGSAQFGNGVRRAEFWKTIKGSPGYQNELKFFYADPFEVTADAANGITDGGDCEQIGILNLPWLDAILQAKLPQILSSPGMPSTAVVLFLLRNVQQCETFPPTPNGSCDLGYHWVADKTRQTYAVIEWDTSGRYADQGVSDASIASHEIGEWMDDPLGTNPTPPWGGVAGDPRCYTNLEVGDPLSGTLMPPITVNGRTYQMQELAFFSWYYNKDTDPSVGAGGKFSTNGTLSGPEKACPPGGTN